MSASTGFVGADSSKFDEEDHRRGQQHNQRGCRDTIVDAIDVGTLLTRF